MAETVVTALTPTEAVRLILAHVHPLTPIRRPLADALDLVLAETVTSPMDIPPWPNSAMDGYALRAADIPSVPATLRVVESVPAGQFPRRPVGPGRGSADLHRRAHTRGSRHRHPAGGHGAGRPRSHHHRERP